MQVDTRAMMAQIPMFVEIDKEVDNFYKLLKEKNIEPKNYNDIERIEKFFNKTLKEITNIVKKSEYSDEDKTFLLSKLTVDMYGKLGDEYNLDFQQIPVYMGRWNVENFNQAAENLSKMM